MFSGDKAHRSLLMRFCDQRILRQTCTNKHLSLLIIFKYHTVKKMKGLFDPFLAQRDFHHLLITFANSLYPDQDNVPEIFFEKVTIGKSQQMTKHEKLPSKQMVKQSRLLH